MLAEMEIETSDLAPVQQLCVDRFGKRVNPSTVWRWIHKGTRGVRLQAVFQLGLWQSTPEAFDAFFRGQTASALRQPAKLDDRPEATKRRLREKGLLN